MPSGRGRGRPPKVRRGPKASVAASSSPIAPFRSGVYVEVPGVDIAYLQEQATKSEGSADSASGNETFVSSTSQRQETEEHDVAEDPGNGDGDEVAAAKPESVAKRGRGRPKMVLVPTEPPQVAVSLKEEDEGDSKIWGIQILNSEVNNNETAFSPPGTTTKRGRGRPRKADKNVDTKVIPSTPNGRVKRGRGRPRKSETNTAVDQITALLPNTSSQRRPGRPKKVIDGETAAHEDTQSPLGSVSLTDDSAINNTEEGEEGNEDAEKFKQEDGEELHDHEEPEVRRYDVHKASPASAKVGMKRKRDVREIQENLVDTLSSAPRNMFRPATLRAFGPSRQLDGNATNTAISSMPNTPVRFKNDPEAEEDPTQTHSPKRPRLLPSVEFTTSATLGNSGNPNTAFQHFSRFGTYHTGTGLDGSHLSREEEEHAAREQANAAFQELREAYGSLSAIHGSTGLHLTRATSQSREQPPYPEQRLLQPAMPTSQGNDQLAESLRRAVFPMFPRVSGGRSAQQVTVDGGSRTRRGAWEADLSASPADIIYYPGAGTVHAGLYYGVNVADSVAPIAPTLGHDGWVEDMFDFDEFDAVE
ncbi:hypothetical protein MMC11_005122 [Xylographa trunciseda]|nr:hypothetical protein [Xylographa trunciseda]